MAEWKIRHLERRAITLEEHQKILAAETNPERKAFYELAWHTGASQSDIALLRNEDIDRNQRVISCQRKKTWEYALIRFGDDVEAILRRLPAEGPLFPYLRTVRPGDRATEFIQRTRALQIQGVSLHSYRYAWAERARRCGYPIGLPRKPSDTTPRPSTGPTPARRTSSSRPCPPSNGSRPWICPGKLGFRLHPRCRPRVRRRPSRFLER